MKVYIITKYQYSDGSLLNKHIVKVYDSLKKVNDFLDAEHKNRLNYVVETKEVE